VIPGDETLFHFINHPEDYLEIDGVGRLRSNIFHKSYPLSFNRASVWSLEHHLLIAQTHWGLCSLAAADIRNAYRPETDTDERKKRGALDVTPDPLDMDPLLQIANPSHASVNRPMSKGESGTITRIASQNVHRPPRRTASD
jgi:hypothetical protein